MIELNITILVIILNENGLNSLVKKQLVSQSKEIRLSYILFTRDTENYKDTDTSKANGLERRHIMLKVNFKTSVTRNKERGPCIKA